MAYELGRGPRTILLTAAIHGIEVIGALALQESFAAIANDGDLLSRARLVIVPTANPDAFVKNLERAGRGERTWLRCNANGVDLNRNFPPLGQSASMHPFSGTRMRAAWHYAGPHAFSEPESRALRDLVLDIHPQVSLGFHSFGNMLLYPWGYTREPNPRAAHYERLGEAFNAGTKTAAYRVRQATSLYPTTGDMDDWLDAHFGCLAMTVEVGALHRRVFHPMRLINPLHWMNPEPLRETIDNVAPATVALLRAATTTQTAPVTRLPVRRRPELPIAAK